MLMSTLKATTTSIRLPSRIAAAARGNHPPAGPREELDRLAGTGRIPCQGDDPAFAQEARRQSVRASEGVTPDEVFWEEAAESGGEAVRKEIALKKLNKLAHEWTRRNPNPLA